MMNLRRHLQFSFLAVGLIIFPPIHSFAEELSLSCAFDKYAEIKSRILQNCYDCMGGSASDLLDGIEDLQSIVDSGFKSREALELLANARRDYALAELPRGSAEQDAALRAHSALYRGLIDENPDSIDLLTSFVRSSQGATEEHALDRLISLSERTLAEGYYLLAVTILTRESANDKNLGIKRLEQAFDVGDLNQKKLFGIRLASELEAVGRSAEAAKVRQTISRL